MNRPMTHLRSSALFGLAAIYSFSLTAFAQNDQTRLSHPFSDQADENGIVNGHAVSTSNDADLGDQNVLAQAQSYQPFSFSAGVPFYFTSNAALSHSGERSDFVFAPRVDATYQPRLTDNLFGLFRLD